jgi:hypothetical protein
MSGMGRREFVALIGGAAAAWPLVARAQQATMPVIGFLNSLGGNDRPNLRDAFHRGLGEAGLVPGSNVTIEYRYADNQIHRLPALAADLANRRVAVIAATGGGASVRAAKGATTAIRVRECRRPGERGLRRQPESARRQSYRNHLVRNCAQRQGFWVAARACSQRRS